MLFLETTRETFRDPFGRRLLRKSRYEKRQMSAALYARYCRFFPGCKKFFFPRFNGNPKLIYLRIFKREKNQRGRHGRRGVADVKFMKFRKT